MCYIAPMDIRDELDQYKADMDAAPARRAALIAKARAQTPPVTWREIASRLGITEHGAVKASRMGQDSGNSGS